MAASIMPLTTNILDLSQFYDSPGIIGKTKFSNDGTQ